MSASLRHTARAAAVCLVSVAGASDAWAQPAGAAEPADSAAARPHQVRRGETLWDLAGHYLRDPYRWPMIHEANAAKISDPHWIYPGQRLRIPAAIAQGAAPAARPATPSVFAQPPATRVATPVPPIPSAVSTSVEEAVAAHWLAAPYVAPAGTLRAGGRIVDGMDVPSHGSRESTRRFHLMDRVAVALPAGARTDSGAAYVVAEPGPQLAGGTVVVPVALAVLDGGGNSAVRTARLVRIFGRAQVGQSLVALAGDAPASGGQRAGSSRVSWVGSAGTLPTLQAHVILDRGARDGVRAGDRFELVAEGRRAPTGEPLPGVRVAVVEVVRVSAEAATAIVTHHDQPAISAGLEARPIAR